MTCFACALNPKAPATPIEEARAGFISGLAWSMACSTAGVIVNTLCAEHRGHYTDMLAGVRKMMADTKPPPAVVNEGAMPQEAERLVKLETTRHIENMWGLLKRWPSFRRSIVYGFLGGMIGEADSFGCDVEAFVAHLRRTETKPGVFHPPKETAS